MTLSEYTVITLLQEQYVSVIASETPRALRADVEIPPLCNHRNDKFRPMETSLSTLGWAVLYNLAIRCELGGRYAALRAILSWGNANDALKVAAEMTLVGEADLLGNGGDR